MIPITVQFSKKSANIAQLSSTELTEVKKYKKKIITNILSYSTNEEHGISDMFWPKVGARKC